MENENESKEQVGSYKKSKDIVITRSQLKKIAIGLLILICAFLIFTYFNSGFTHKKAEEAFRAYWNKENVSSEIKNVNILGTKKNKKNEYLVKVEFTYLEGEYLTFLKHPDLAKKELYEARRHYQKGDYIFSKWDTGWFIEEKKK